MQNSHQSNLSQKLTFESKANEIFQRCYYYALLWKNHSLAYTAEDLAQEALIRIWQAFDKYDASKSKLTTFVYEIATNVFKDICKSTRNAFAESYNVLFEEAPAFVVESKASHEEYFSGKAVSFKGIDVSSLDDLYPAYVDRLMSHLPERQHSIVERTYGVGNHPWEQSDKCIAEELGITRQTVISDRKKAIETMKLRAVKRTHIRCAA